MVRKRILNKRALPYVQKLLPFTGSNLFSKNVGSLYVVYSYGDHWPLWVYDPALCQWYGNRDKQSPATSRHQVLTCPESDPEAIIWMDSNTLLQLIKTDGYAGQAKLLLGNVV